MTRTTLAVLFAALATALSAYLTWLHYSGTLALCLGSGGCEVVQSSRYSMIGDVPVALIGLVGSAAMLGVALWRLRTDAPAALLALFGLSLTATLFIAYLTYLELFVIGAVCPWCVAVAVCVVAVLAVTSLELAAPSA